MKTLSLALTALATLAVLPGCALAPPPEAQHAKAALIARIRSDPKAFAPYGITGPDPERLATMEVRPRGRENPDEYTVGGFVIDVKKRWYSADIGSEKYGMFFFSGVFEVDAAGQWTAGAPEVRHALPLRK